MNGRRLETIPGSPSQMRMNPARREASRLLGYASCIKGAAQVTSRRTPELIVKTLDATSRAGGVVAVVVLSAALSGCYYYVPYGYVPYGEVPAAAPQQQYPFSMTDAAVTGAAASDVTASTNTYIAPVAPVFVVPAHYPVAYPYYGSPTWWGPSVSLSIGYWGGCCYGGGRYGYWGHHGYWGHGYRGGSRGWGGHGNWGGHGYLGRGMGGGQYWGGGGGHGRSH